MRYCNVGVSGEGLQSLLEKFQLGKAHGKLCEKLRIYQMTNILGSVVKCVWEGALRWKLCTGYGISGLIEGSSIVKYVKERYFKEIKVPLGRSGVLFNSSMATGRHLKVIKVPLG